jgi:SAM-dependent methyltransferase
MSEARTSPGSTPPTSTWPNCPEPTGPGTGSPWPVEPAKHLSGVRVPVDLTAKVLLEPTFTRGRPLGGCLTDIWRRGSTPGRRPAAGVRHGAATGHRPGTGYDTELRLHHAVLRRMWGVQPRDHVLDIGCGTGQTTRAAARMAQAGSALGVDISAAAIERARDLARAEGLGNVRFECADAQVHCFPPGRFDLAVSRFGTMFFDHPGVAFANIGRALRPAGRLAMMVWQAPERNEWDVEIRRSLGGPAGPVAVAPEGPDPFSLADPSTVAGILEAAGFVGVSFTDVHEPVYYGPDVAAALGWVRGFASTKHVLERLDSAAATHALGRLREALVAHLSDDGVWFDSRAWIVTAVRA